MSLTDNLISANGDCYCAAARFLLDLGSSSNARLVHGEVRGQGSLAGFRFGHAWVEINGWVIDVSNGRNLCMQRSQYYATGQIDPMQVRSYSCTEVILLTSRFGHYGPWEN
jgi:hypothetical protein